MDESLCCSILIALHYRTAQTARCCTHASAKTPPCTGEAENGGRFFWEESRGERRGDYFPASVTSVAMPTVLGLGNGVCFLSHFQMVCGLKSNHSAVIQCSFYPKLHNSSRCCNPSYICEIS